MAAWVTCTERRRACVMVCRGPDVVAVMATCAGQQDQRVGRHERTELVASLLWACLDSSIGQGSAGLVLVIAEREQLMGMRHALPVSGGVTSLMAPATCVCGNATAVACCGGNLQPSEVITGSQG